MIRTWIALLILLAATQSAMAFAVMKPEECAQALEIIGVGTERPDAIGISKDGWCQMPQGFGAGASLEWRAEGLAQLLQHSRAPGALEIRIQSEDLLDLLAQGKEPGAPPIPVQIVLTLRSNADENQVVIEQLRIMGPKDNTLLLQGILHDVDLSSFAMAQVSMGSAKLRDVSLIASGNRHLEPYLRPYFGRTFPERSRRRTAMVAKVSDWPDQSFPPATKRAVKQLIANLPAPNGTFRAKIDMGPGLSAGAFVRPYVFGDMQDDIVQNILGGMVFHAEWTPLE